MHAEDFLFTSESVSEGHPDKLADQISDAILDHILSQDKEARVACETVVKTGLVFIAGEVTTTAIVDIEKVVRELIARIGYTHSTIGFDAQTCAIITSIGKQSPDIAQGVDRQQQAEQGAGDQGLMFGYASNETAVYMPAPIMYAHRLMQQQATLRHNGTLPWLRPDAKAQITIRYQHQQPVGVDNIVFSTQHDPDITLAELTEAVIESIIKPIIPATWLQHTRYLINPTGRFVIGGPQGDCGLTGRKIIVDSYGGMAHHGGGCFSGKDPSKVDRTGAYMARYIAKNIVAARLAARCEVQLAYAIGIAKPTAIYVNTFGTGVLTDMQLVALIQQHFDLRPAAMIQTLNLLNTAFLPTASYGHFGRAELNVAWEKEDKAALLATAIK